MSDASIFGGVAYFDIEDGIAEFKSWWLKCVIYCRISETCIYSDLIVSHSGEYVLKIQITHPRSQAALEVETNRILVSITALR